MNTMQESTYKSIYSKMSIESTQNLTPAVLLKKYIFIHKYDLIRDLKLNVRKVCKVCLTSNRCADYTNTCKCNHMRCVNCDMLCHNNYKGPCSCTHGTYILDICSCNRKCILDYASVNVTLVIDEILKRAYNLGGYELLEKYGNIYTTYENGRYGICIKSIVKSYVQINPETPLKIIKPMLDVVDYNTQIICFNTSRSLFVIDYVLKVIQNMINNPAEYVSNSMRHVVVLQNKIIYIVADYFRSDDESDTFYFKTKDLIDIIMLRGVELKLITIMLLKDITILSPKDIKLLTYMCRRGYISDKLITEIKSTKFYKNKFFQIILDIYNTN